jgi:hypothetical protein
VLLLSIRGGKERETERIVQGNWPQCWLKMGWKEHWVGVNEALEMGEMFELSLSVAKENRETLFERVKEDESQCLDALKFIVFLAPFHLFLVDSLTSVQFGQDGGRGSFD